MEPIKVVYQKKTASPRQTMRKKTLRTASPVGIRDQSSKLFRIQVNTPTFYRPQAHHSVKLPPHHLTDDTKKPKKTRVSYLPHSTVYKKLNVRLTLHNLEFFQSIQKESRQGNRSQFRKTIDYTSQKAYNINSSPLEAIGSSINITSGF